MRQANTSTQITGTINLVSRLDLESWRWQTVNHVASCCVLFLYFTYDLPVALTVQDKGKQVNNRRHEEPQPQLSMDSVEVYDAKFPVSRTLSDLSVGKDDAAKDEDEDEGRRKRLSSGRPLRQAVAKLKSYKEMPLNFKMWRSE
ncbi:hypothetical protein Dsin_020706 [Dipteronia sinensis]|uniref:Uncharacterized protein n=1 Tax=Dipteronia sinensis TaxID=43782 RepID=A0AAE0AA00_9ROSI|nr:hypothetical protein Dsin_020706 [Dipteronia sinensis]